jgi:hypothetical protein
VRVKHGCKLECLLRQDHSYLLLVLSDCSNNTPRHNQHVQHVLQAELYVAVTVCNSNYTSNSIGMHKMLDPVKRAAVQPLPNPAPLVQLLPWDNRWKRSAGYVAIE